MTGPYLTSNELAARYKKTLRTIYRWIANPPSGFPTPIELNGRHMWPAAAIAEFERQLAAAAKNS
jgi:predicted DNA-binding transcriptional regulator AlpA